MRSNDDDKLFARRRIAMTGAGSSLGRALALRSARDGRRESFTESQAGGARPPAGEVNVAKAGVASLSESIRAVRRATRTLIR